MNREGELKEPPVQIEHLRKSKHVSSSLSKNVIAVNITRLDIIIPQSIICVEKTKLSPYPLWLLLWMPKGLIRRKMEVIWQLHQNPFSQPVHVITLESDSPLSSSTTKLVSLPEVARENKSRQAC